MIHMAVRCEAEKASEAAEGKIKGDGASLPQILVCTSGFTCTWDLNPCAGEMGQVPDFVSENMVHIERRALFLPNRSHVPVRHDEQR